MRIIWSFVIVLGLFTANPLLAQEAGDSDVGDVEELDEGDDDFLQDEDSPSLIDQVKAEARQNVTQPAPPLNKFPAVDRSSVTTCWT